MAASIGWVVAQAVTQLDYFESFALKKQLPIFFKSDVVGTSVAADPEKNAGRDVNILVNNLGGLALTFIGLWLGGLK